MWFFSLSIVTKSSLDIWSVFLQDGVTLFGFESNVLISSEGITTVGLLGALFPARPRGGVLSSFGRPVGSEAVRVPHSVVFASGEDSVCIPLANGLPEELLLCPVRSVREYLRRTSSFVNCPRRLFVSPWGPSRALSKNGISFLLREVIVQSGASLKGGAAPRAHSIRLIATSSAFFKNWSISSVLEAASWKSNSVFTSFYFRDFQYVFEGVCSLGPFVTAGERIG